MRSIPEKTLEHWASIYVLNRFPNSAMWWPASGEDVLVDLPQVAASGPGETLALELKTTAFTDGRHVLTIDVKQLARYLDPPSGPPLPVYYVFPIPHWDGPLTSRHGVVPVASNRTIAAPPQWRRHAAGPSWFGNWLYVMSAQSLSHALSIGWQSLKTTRLFSVKAPHAVGSEPDWPALFPRIPPAPPIPWPDFWRGHRRDGVQWFTVGEAEHTHVIVLTRDGETSWSLGRLLQQPQPELGKQATESAGHMLLRIA
jgi:hypothetical protein